MKCLSLAKVPVLDPGAKPLEPFGKGSNALKAEARDARPTVLPVSKEAGRPFSSQPGSMERAVYRGFSQKGKVKQRTRLRPKSSYEFAVPLILVIAAV
jgi:hypothetical protein